MGPPKSKIDRPLLADRFRLDLTFYRKLAGPLVETGQQRVTAQPA